MEQKIETPFKIKNSKLDGYKYPIPEGYEAEIKDGKIIIKKSENEDERIRKELINYLYDVHEDDEERARWIAWLEKQGEQKPTDNLTPQEAMDIAVAKCFEQDEQKSADMVEPKFKVGDWIIHNKNIELANSIMLVTGKDNNAYLCKYINGQCSYNIEFIDKDYHLWTIQDAKDGDVLVLNSEIFIYTHRKQMYSIAVAQCFVDSAGGFHLDGEFGYVEHGGTISPATKEQSDILMKAIADAGYTFDFEKKELKKIEQRIADNQFTPEQASVLDKHIDKFVEQNPAWSEEDEKYFNILISLANNPSAEGMFDYHRINKSVFNNWVKSLKDRYTWKPTMEQLAFFKGILDYHGSDFSSEGLRVMKEILAQLKAL